MRRSPTGSFLQAAVAVLEATTRPMTSREITDEALRRGLITTSGKTPEASMSAALYTRPPDSRIQQLAAPGRQRARRGSVRWSLN